MKKLLILITAIVCLGFSLAFAGVPITSVLAKLGTVVIFLIGATFIVGPVFFGLFYAFCILCLASPFLASLFVGNFIATVFHLQNESIVVLIGVFLFILFLCLSTFLFGQPYLALMEVL